MNTQEIAFKISEAMANHIMDNPKEYQPSDDFESVFEQYFEVYISPYAANLSEDATNELYIQLFNSKPVDEAIEEMRIFLKEHYTDAYMYATDKYSYYGLKQSDFL